MDTGFVRYSPSKSLWFGSFALAALVLGPLTFTPGAAALFAVTTFVTLCFGHSVGVHRRLIHKSYRVPRWLEHTLVWLGVLVGLAGPLGLIALHHTRDEQQNRPACDDYFAHRRWALVDYVFNLHCVFVFDQPYQPRRDFTAEADPFYRWLERTWRWQQLPLALVFFWWGGLPFLVWGIAMRVFVSTTGHWLVGWFSHRQGAQRWVVPNAAVQGFNSLLLGALSMGEGFHNTHHAFPRSARMGLKLHELDLGWWFIRALAALRLATCVQVPGRRMAEHITLQSAPIRDTIFATARHRDRP